MTHEQAQMLGAIKAQHGELEKLPEESPLGDHVLSGCVSDSYAYRCRDCLTIFTVEPDGVTDMWMCASAVD